MRSKVFVVSILVLVALPLEAAASPSGPGAASAKSPASWKPFLLSSARQFRLAAPPSAASAQTKTEIAQLLRLQKGRTPAVKANIQKWLGQPAVVPWWQLELSLLKNYRPRVAPASRTLALLGAAMYDAAIAADDSRLAYAKRSRPAPWKLNKRLKAAVKVSAGTTWAPYEAAMSGAAERVLAYLYPGEPKRTFTRLANESIQACLSAGVNYRSDLQRARALGQKVGDLAIAHGQADGSSTTGFSEGPFVGEPFWVTTPPSFEGAVGSAVGNWKPWLLANPKKLWSVIPPPPAYGSPEFMTQVKAVLDTSTTLTETQRQIADFWDDRPGTFTPPGHWIDIALQLTKSYKADGLRALRATAYLGVADQDAVISWFGLKYHYWTPRPITAIWRLGADGNLKTEAQCSASPSLCPYRNKWYSYITTPPFPSYPAGHPTLSGLGGKLLTYFFPGAKDTLNQLAEQVALSRLYGGIHYPMDNEKALILGRALADVYIEQAKTDGRN